jgi:hypothetical protein
MIRPIDLQSTIIAATNPAAAQRTEEGSRINAQAAQAAFAAELSRCDESVAPTNEVLGNRIGAEPDAHDKREGGAHKREPGSAFEEVVDEAAGLSEEAPHIVDFTA